MEMKTTQSLVHDSTMTEKTIDEGRKELPHTVIFPHLTYDVTDYGCQFFLCLTCPFHFLPLVPGIMGRKTMELEAEEAVLVSDCNPFCNIVTRRPYGELGSVDQKTCLCCLGVGSNLSEQCPIYNGWGCRYDEVGEIIAELKARMKARGDTGQIARAEQALEELADLKRDVLDVKTDLKQIMAALNIQDHKQKRAPPSSANVIERA